MCQSDSAAMRLRDCKDPPSKTPRRWPRCALGAVALVMVANSRSDCSAMPAACRPLP